MEYKKIRSAILWKEMTPEEKKFYEQEYKEYVDKLVGWKTRPQAIEEIIDEDLLFCVDKDGKPYILMDTENY